MAFHEVRFPEAIGRGARGGPERRTQVTYASAAQISDFGALLGPGDTLDLRIFQL